MDTCAVFTFLSISLHRVAFVHLAAIYSTDTWRCVVGWFEVSLYEVFEGGIA